ncbi:MAG: PAS domain-containing protein [Chitinophagaceae bacterium]|nr:PAS domain-containing protein [Chitinophagaceae bacterium]
MQYLVTERTRELRLIQEQLEEKVAVRTAELSRANTALQESENRFRAFMDNSPAIAWAKDEAGRILYLSQTYENRFGVTLADWLGKTDLELWPPAIAEKSRRHDLAVLANGQPLEVIEQTSHAGGKQCSWWIFRFPFEDAAGHRYLGGIGVDITERQQAEEDLRLLNEKLEQRVEARTAQLVSAYGQLDAFFTHSITPMVFLDQNFNFIRVNEAYARACQRRVEDFPGHNHFEFYPNAANQAIFAEVLRTKKPYQAVARPFEFPDHPEWGVTYWDWTLMPILDENDQVDFFYRFGFFILWRRGV